MKTALTLLASVAVLLTLNGCFKDEPKREMKIAAGSWRIEQVTIQQNDSLGNEVSTSEIEGSLGLLMLSHDDDFMYEGRYSYSYDGDALASSGMNSLFVACDTWGLGEEGKVFNLGNNDGSTGYTTHVAAFTVLKLRRKKMELQYVRVHPQTGYLYSVETWKLVRATHL